VVTIVGDNARLHAVRQNFSRYIGNPCPWQAVSFGGQARGETVVLFGASEHVDSFKSSQYTRDGENDEATSTALEFAVSSCPVRQPAINLITCAVFEALYFGARRTRALWRRIVSDQRRGWTEASAKVSTVRQRGQLSTISRSAQALIRLTCNAKTKKPIESNGALACFIPPAAAKRTETHLCLLPTRL